MRDVGKILVTNTTPIISLVAATGSLDVFKFLYSRVVVPFAVAQEVQAGGQQAFGVDVFHGADWLDIQTDEITLQPFLRNSLDRGEAAVIQTALNFGLPLVCIDETIGRRVARLCSLEVTGTIGVLLKAQKLGFSVSMSEAVRRMREHGIWLSDSVVHFALTQGQ